MIPLHIHLAKLNFLKYRTDGRTFTAKPPDHFFWTCEKLGLTIPEEYSENRVSDKVIDLVNPDSDDGGKMEWGSENEREKEHYMPTINTEDIQLDFDDSRTSQTECKDKS